LGSNGNYFQKLITVNWTGWKKIIIPLSSWGKARQPVGWNFLTGFMMYPQNIQKASEKTVLYLDQMQLENIPASTLAAMQIDEQLCAPLSKPRQMSSLASPGANGKLTYQTDGRGNRLPDFSIAGYRSGGVPIPDVPARITLSPSAGADDAVRIQQAVDRLSLMTPDTNGFRGALLLKKGKYEITNTIYITNSGIVVRGEGAGFGGTWILHRAIVSVHSNPQNMCHFPQKEKGMMSTFETVGSNFETELLTPITSDYMGWGQARCMVADVTRLSNGQDIVVVCTQTQAWVDALKMSPGWSPEPFIYRWERKIIGIDQKAGEITIDAPITSAIDRGRGFAAGEIHRIVSDPRVAQVGFENFMVLSDFDKTKKDAYSWYNGEFHANNAFRFYHARDGWIRRVVGFFYSFSFVSTGYSARLTVEDCAMLDGVSKDTPNSHAGARKYYFNISGNNIFVQRCYARYARHAFIANGPWSGGVWLDCYSEKGHIGQEPHQMWSHGFLYDNVWSDTQINLRGGIPPWGQLAANCLVWGCLVNNSRVFDLDIMLNAPLADTAMNYAIGNILIGGLGVAKAIGTNDGYGVAGWNEHTNVLLTPRSIYLAQLTDRLGADALPAVATPAQLKEKGEVWKDLVLKYSDLPEYADPLEAPWKGWKKWVVQYKK